MTALSPELMHNDIFLSEVVIIANPAAAGVSSDLIRRIENRFAANAIGFRTTWTDGPTGARRIVHANPGAGVFVAVGGDGTMAEVAAAMAAGRRAGQVLLGLPAGSGNSTCRNLWGDLSLSQVLDLVDRPRACTVRTIDLMHLVEPAATVLLGASTGFLAQVLIGARDVDPAVKGIDRYYTAAVDVLDEMPAHSTRVTVDGVVRHDGPASSVTVGGGRFRARSFEFLPGSLLGDGLLDVSVIAAMDSAAIAEMIPLIQTGQHLSRPEVRYARGVRVVIERTDGKSLVAEFDGDVWDAAGPRLTIDVLPGALSVLAPVVAPCG